MMISRDNCKCLLYYGDYSGTIEGEVRKLGTSFLSDEQTSVSLAKLIKTLD
jgi:hypothetical protein